MSTQQCQFFLTKKGCRNGDSCRFSHTRNNAQLSPTGTGTPITTTSPPSSPSISTQDTARTARKRVVTARQPVTKPVPASLQNLDRETTAASLRAFEITQLQSRFSSSFAQRPTADEEVADAYELKIVPSDPDFPYEIDALHVLLAVPKTYPTQPCSVAVLNRDIPKGFATNLERGFAQAAQRHKSLLAHLNWLDVNMEQLLQKPPAPTIRFIGHANHANNNSNNTTSSRTVGNNSSNTSTSSALLPPPLPVAPPSLSQITSPKSMPSTNANPTSQPPRQHPPALPIQKTFTPAEREQASLQRQKQMNQIQARFRSSYESISPTSVNISLESTDKDKMPVKWQGPLWIVLLVPALYPLEPCDIRLRENGNNPEIEIWRARNVEQGFRKIAATMPQLSLFQLLNHLNQDLKDLMSLPAPSTLLAPVQPTPSASTSTTTSHPSQSIFTATPSKGVHDNKDDKKGMLIYVEALQGARKGNFDTIQDHGAVTSDDDDEEEENDEENDSSDADDDDKGDQDREEEEEDESTSKAGPVVESAPKRGIEIRMPELKLEHISLMYCRSLNLLVRCSRCKALVDMPELLPDDSAPSHSSPAAKSGTDDKRKWRTCENCQSLLGAHFRTEYIHIQSRTIGYLDLAGCTAYDILPSSFVPTCSECDQVHGSGVDEHNHQTSSEPTSASDTQAPSGSVPVPTTSSQPTALRSSPTGFRQKVGRGMSATANCRKCHVRLTFTMEGEIKFVKLSPGDLMRASAADLEKLPLKKKLTKSDKYGLDFEVKVGEPLPRKGACDHYKKSLRWFRFPCCSKIYPCHLCHDEKEAESHEGEYAKRMICGHCSREQVVSDKPCLCGKSPVRTAGGSGAFWEGGEGMRDRSRMSNKDSRKHKGLHKTVAKKQVGAENVRKRAPKT
ncbi:hypothetical protein BGX33_007982 [Mortierella sp. NVP41]|nr:hypothetical protein BGX33_007982 [Mortierella sp. NVP41]